MENVKLESWQARVDAARVQASGESVVLMDEMLNELKLLHEQNAQLRKSLVQARQKSKMSTKLKEALYE
ncbi:hypothetical protein [Paenibacillus aquistagni]|uniref:hypothetical protein n=1 Tax=Paenibacillus aquistagni TaxID=1852522 RepID=UPI00145B8CCF|nr:hypothetical protein [Paenibacillus aquistagni]NMM51269.1 hypothetical protein [Paenibacillus aquistagni]